jgi:hypothetical protein
VLKATFFADAYLPLWGKRASKQEIERVFVTEGEEARLARDRRQDKEGFASIWAQLASYLT